MSSSANGNTGTGGNELISLVQKAIDFHKAGNVEDAIASYEEVLPLLTGNTKASLCGNVGALYMSQGNYEKAKDHFVASVEADPDNPSAHFNLAVVLTSKLGQHGKAIKHCGKAINLDPENNYKAYHLMGNIMQTIGRPDEASQYFISAENIAREQSLKEAGQVDPGSSTADSSPKNNPLEKLPMYGATVGSKITATVEGTEYTAECVSERPLIFIVDDLISEEECAHIQGSASQHLEKSYVMGGGGGGSSINTAATVVEPTGGMERVSSIDHQQTREKLTLKQADQEDVVDPSLYRSSYNAWLPQDRVLNKLQQRLSSLLGISSAYLQQKSEELQVVQYKTGGQFKVHQDSSAFNNRLLTALLYLNTITPIPSSTSSSHGTSSSSPSSKKVAVVVEGAEESNALTTYKDTIYGGETWFPYALSPTDGKLETTEAVTVEEAISQALHIYESSTTKSTTKTGTTGASGAVGEGVEEEEQEEEEAQSSSSSRHHQSHPKAQSLPGLKIAPKRGTAVIFFNHLLSSSSSSTTSAAAVDPLAVHAGLPVKRRLRQMDNSTATSGNSSSSSSSSSSTAAAVPVTESENENDKEQETMHKWVANYWVELDVSLIHDNFLL